MKRWITPLMILICIFSLSGCSNTSTSLDGIENTAEVKIIQYDKSNGTECGAIILTETANIQHIIDNLNSLELKRKKAAPRTIIEYKLFLINSNHEVIEMISISVDDWIHFDGHFHFIQSGEIDRFYIEELFK